MVTGGRLRIWEVPRQKTKGHSKAILFVHSIKRGRGRSHKEIVNKSRDVLSWSVKREKNRIKLVLGTMDAKQVLYQYIRKTWMKRKGDSEKRGPFGF